MGVRTDGVLDPSERVRIVVGLGDGVFDDGLESHERMENAALVTLLRQCGEETLYGIHL